MWNFARPFNRVRVAIFPVLLSAMLLGHLITTGRNIRVLAEVAPLVELASWPPLIQVRAYQAPQSSFCRFQRWIWFADVDVFRSKPTIIYRGCAREFNSPDIMLLRLWSLCVPALVKISSQKLHGEVRAAGWTPPTLRIIKFEEITDWAHTFFYYLNVTSRVLRKLSLINGCRLFLLHIEHSSKWLIRW